MNAHVEVSIRLAHMQYFRKYCVSADSTGMIKWKHIKVCFECIILRGVICNTLSRAATLSKWFRFPSEKGSILNGKNLLPLGANSFLFELAPFQKGSGVQESKLKVTKVASIVKKVGNCTKFILNLQNRSCVSAV